MANFPCPVVNKSCLPCNDDPIANLSAEEPDVDVFVGFNDYFGDPPLGHKWAQIGCKRICYSDVSQQEADDCALLQAQECAWGTWTPPQDPPLPPDDPPGGPPGVPDTPGGIPTPYPRNPTPTYRNTLQCCEAVCSDGTPFLKCQAAGTVGALSQAEANAKALSLACKRANKEKVCIVNQPTTGCVQDAYSFQILVVGGTKFDVGTGYVFNLFGSLPPGLTLNGTTGVISGTPTTAGSYFFEVDVFDAAGNFSTAVYTLCVGEITNATALPNGTEGSPYLELLEFEPLDATGLTWAVSAGSLPDGLTLNADGTITGTPTSINTFNFTAVASGTCFGQTIACEKSFVLQIESGVDCMGEAQAVQDLSWNDTTPVGSGTFTIAGGDGTYSAASPAPDGQIGIKADCTLCNPSLDAYDLTIQFDWTQTTDVNITGQAQLLLDGNAELGPVENTSGVKQWVKVVSLPSGIHTLELRLNGSGIINCTWSGTVTVRPLTPP